MMMIMLMNGHYNERLEKAAPRKLQKKTILVKCSILVGL